MFGLIFIIIKIFGIGILISIAVMLFSAVLKIFGSLPIGSITASKKAINYYDKNLCTRQISQNPYPIRLLPS